MKPDLFWYLPWVGMLLQVGLAQGMAQGIASFKEPCRSDASCDSQKLLVCSRKGRCECRLPESMIFEGDPGQCGTRAGKRCLFTYIEGNESLSDLVSCISNAACINSVCECYADYYEVSNGTCHEKRGYLQECQGNEMCQEMQHLICDSSGKCGCQPNRVYSASFRGCVLGAGQPCSSKERCTQNSKCHGDTCVCDWGHFASDRGTCDEKRKLNEPCQRSEQCLDTVLRNLEPHPSMIVCLNGTCACDPAEAVETVDAFGGRFCGKWVGGPCSQNESHECTSGATCRGIPSTCQCNHASHFGTADRTCERRRKLNEPCTHSSQCDTIVDKLTCSASSGTCQCDGNRIIDPETSTCKLRVHSECTPGDNGDDNCVSNAVCDTTHHKCRCQATAKSVAMLSDYCYIKEGETCFGDLHSPVTSKTCLPGLLCRNKTCTCPYKGHQVYNEKLERCVSHVAGPCEIAEDCHDPHAECLREGMHESQQCRCRLGYVEVGQSCQISFGEKCGQREESLACDSLAPLECSSRGLCECGDLQWYDKGQLGCRGLVGATCNPEKDSSFCFGGAFCKKLRGFDERAGICTCEPGTIMREDRTCSSRN